MFLILVPNLKIKYLIFHISMDRNRSYYNYLNECMEHNKLHKKTYPAEVPCAKVKKSRSKEDLHLLSISEIMFDNKMKISDNDYIKIMNHLKDLSGYSTKNL